MTSVVAASAAAAVAAAPAVSQAAPTSSGPVTLGAFAAIGLILAVQPFSDPANHINMVQPNQLEQIQRMLNMTDRLQVMDLVTNAPLKSGLFIQLYFHFKKM